MKSNIDNEIAMRRGSDCNIRKTPTTYMPDRNIARYVTLGSLNLNQEFSSVLLLWEDRPYLWTLSRLRTRNTSTHSQNWQNMPKMARKKNRRKQKKSATMNMIRVIHKDMESILFLPIVVINGSDVDALVDLVSQTIAISWSSYKTLRAIKS